MGPFFAVIHRNGEAGLDSQAAAITSALVDKGWRPSRPSPGVVVMVKGDTAPSLREIEGDVVIGQIFARRPVAAPLQAGGGARSLGSKAEAYRDNHWGRFVALLRGADGDLAIYRDPSGVLDPFVWPLSDSLIVATELPNGLPASACPTVRIVWAEVLQHLNHPGDVHYKSPLEGVVAIAPGGLAIWDGRHIKTQQLWRPADHIDGPSRSVQAHADALRGAVDEALQAFANEGVSAVAECSGGFDSSVVATGLKAHGQSLRALLNYATQDLSGDERAFAQVLADHLRLPLDIRLKTPPDFSPAVIGETAHGFRPSFAAMDAAYEADVLDLANKLGTKRVYTGHGGDSVFFQLTTPLVIRDRVLRLGLAGLRPRDVGSLARWSRRSAYELLALGLGLRPWRPPATAHPSWIAVSPPSRHPWVQDLESAGPAKQFQVHSLLQSLDRNGRSRLDGQIDLVHPLLAQPILETALSIPSDLFVYGGRGRALARRAFSDRLPEEIYARRSKGELGAFYARAIVPALPAITAYLREGRLATARLIDPDLIADAFDEETLARQGNFGAMLRAVAIEAWARHWTS